MTISNESGARIIGEAAGAKKQVARLNSGRHERRAAVVNGRPTSMQ